jgi:hypothetical protein
MTVGMGVECVCVCVWGGGVHPSLSSILHCGGCRDSTTTPSSTCVYHRSCLRHKGSHNVYQLWHFILHEVASAIQPAHMGKRG